MCLIIQKSYKFQKFHIPALLHLWFQDEIEQQYPILKVKQNISHKITSRPDSSPYLKKLRNLATTCAPEKKQKSSNNLCSRNFRTPVPNANHSLLKPRDQLCSKQQHTAFSCMGTPTRLTLQALQKKLGPCSFIVSLQLHSHFEA